MNKFLGLMAVAFLYTSASIGADVSGELACNPMLIMDDLQESRMAEGFRIHLKDALKEEFSFVKYLTKKDFEGADFEGTLTMSVHMDTNYINGKFPAPNGLFIIPDAAYHINSSEPEPAMDKADVLASGFYSAMSHSSLILLAKNPKYLMFQIICVFIPEKSVAEK